MKSRRRQHLLTSTLAALTMVTTLAVGTPASADDTTARSGVASNRNTTGSNTLPQLPAPPRPPAGSTSTAASAPGGDTASGTITGTTSRASRTDEVTGTFATAKSGSAEFVDAATTSAATNSGKAMLNTSTAKTLILYNDTGEWGWLGEEYAQFTANLVSHFGAWKAHPVSSYTSGELSQYTAVVYLGSSYYEQIPAALRGDVLTTKIPVIWTSYHLDQLGTGDELKARYGFAPALLDCSDFGAVTYGSATLTRSTLNKAGIMGTAISDPTRAAVLANAVVTNPDGTMTNSTIPWTVRSGNLTYIAEIPLSYVTNNDRYLAFSDLLFDALAPKTAARHRGLVRIEDVGPDSDPAQLRAVADYLYSQKVPYTVAVYPRFRNPKGVDHYGLPQDYTLWTRPALVMALKYMQQRGGTLLLHGYTHQYDKSANPYDGVSGNDFEFYRAHVDAANNVIYDGPVPSDSSSWADNRMDQGKFEFNLAWLNTPTMFEFPHYAASVADYKAAASNFSARYDAGLYFPGMLSTGKPDYTRANGQFFPYAVRDVYGSLVVPENLGNIEPEAYNNHPARLPADLISAAKANLAVRDGTASFFYHPYLGTAYLKQVVEGIKGLGYTFVPASAMLTS